ncbi:MAG TPA: hypothetical protein VFW94_23970 [Candidatus Acidoferrales bacterium]|nr:hypothetical protein [Candidatus Acidoferrales bacterium]
MIQTHHSYQDRRQKTKKKPPNIFVGPGQRVAERRKAMLEQFKSFNADSANVDELVAMAAFGRSLKAEFEARSMKVPEYVAVQNEALDREIKNRMLDERQRRIRDLKAQREGLKTAQEKRESIEKELAALEAATV